MLTEDALRRIEALIEAHGGTKKKKEEMAGALRDLEQAVAGQAVLIGSLAAQLRNKNVGSDALNGVLDGATLKGLFKGLGLPKENPFSVTDAEAASKKVAADVAAATDFSEILKSVVAVAKVFI